MWPHGLIFFLALKVCLANINRLFIQQSHGQGRKHSCGFIIYLITDSWTVKTSPEHIRSIRSISNSLISTDMNWTLNISVRSSNAECKTGEFLPSKRCATDPDSSHEKWFFFVCVYVCAHARMYLCVRMRLFVWCVYLWFMCPDSGLSRVLLSVCVCIRCRWNHGSYRLQTAFSSSCATFTSIQYLSDEEESWNPDQIYNLIIVAWFSTFWECLQKRKPL